MSVIIGLIVLSIIALGTYLFIKNKRKENSIDEVVSKYKESTSTTGIESKIQEIESELLVLNVSVRENVRDPEVIESFENLIDSVISVLPSANEPDNYSEQTVIVNRMSTSYIPKILETYVVLSEGARVVAKAELLKMVSEVQKQMEDIKDSYESLDQAVFDRNTRVMKSLFATYNIKGDI